MENSVSDPPTVNQVNGSAVSDLDFMAESFTTTYSAASSRDIAPAR